MKAKRVEQQKDLYDLEKRNQINQRDALADLIINNDKKVNGIQTISIDLSVYSEESNKTQAS